MSEDVKQQDPLRGSALVVFLKEHFFMCAELPTDEARGRVVSAIVEALQTGQAPKAKDIAERLIAADLIRDAEANARKWASKSHPGKAGAPKGNENAAKGNRKTIEKQSGDNRETIGAGEEEGEGEGEKKEKRTEEESPSDSGPSVCIPSSFGTSDFGAWARQQSDPVAVAIAAAGEGDSARRTFGALLKDIDRRDFIDECVTFVAELDAGETVKNRGAALVARLKRLRDGLRQTPAPVEEAAHDSAMGLGDTTATVPPVAAEAVSRLVTKTRAGAPVNLGAITAAEFIAQGCPGWSEDRARRLKAWINENDGRGRWSVSLALGQEKRWPA